MNISIQLLNDQCEQIQEDLMCILDGLDDEMLDNVCQVIVDRFNILKATECQCNCHYGGFSIDGVCKQPCDKCSCV